MVIMQFKWKLPQHMIKKQNSSLLTAQLLFHKNIGSLMGPFMLIWLLFSHKLLLKVKTKE